MIVVFYDSQDGRIIQCDSGPEHMILADGRPYIAVTAARSDYDLRYQVVDGEVVPIKGDS